MSQNIPDICYLIGIQILVPRLRLRPLTALWWYVILEFSCRSSPNIFVEFFKFGWFVWFTGEKKLSKVIVPDKWKEGASNTSDSGGRKLNENKLLSKKNRWGWWPIQSRHTLGTKCVCAILLVFLIWKSFFLRFDRPWFADVLSDKTRIESWILEREVINCFNIIINSEVHNYWIHKCSHMFVHVILYLNAMKACMYLYSIWTTVNGISTLVCVLFHLLSIILLCVNHEKYQVLYSLG